MSRSVLLLAALTLLLAAPVSAKGPPWIAIEYPANPHDPSTRGAALLVRAYHHAAAMALPVRGTAEGIVNGRRLSQSLDLRPTILPGVYALRTALPREGTWVLVISLEQGKDDIATALVTLDGQAGIAHVEVPANVTRDGWTVPRAVKAADVERALQLAAAGNRDRLGAATHSTGGAGVLAGMLGLPLLLGFMVVRRRTRR